MSVQEATGCQGSAPPGRRAPCWSRLHCTLLPLELTGAAVAWVPAAAGGLHVEEAMLAVTGWEGNRW